MAFAPVFIVERFFYRIAEFLRHWYVGGTRRFVAATLGILRAADRTFALRVTFRNWFKPMYGDFSFFGYFFGILSRTVRILAASCAYASIALAAFALYAVWTLVPPILVAQILLNSR